MVVICNVNRVRVVVVSESGKSNRVNVVAEEVIGVLHTKIGQDCDFSIDRSSGPGGPIGKALFLKVRLDQSKI